MPNPAQTSGATFSSPQVLLGHQKLSPICPGPSSKPMRTRVPGSRSTLEDILCSLSKLVDMSGFSDLLFKHWRPFPLRNSSDEIAQTQDGTSPPCPSALVGPPRDSFWFTSDTLGVFPLAQSPGTPSYLP